jgi:hypothetical protein
MADESHHAHPDLAGRVIAPTPVSTTNP